MRSIWNRTKLIIYLFIIFVDTSALIILNVHIETFIITIIIIIIIIIN